MLHWVVMDIIEVPFQVAFIFDGVLPETSLPDAALFPPLARLGPVSLLTAGFEIPR